MDRFLKNKGILKTGTELYNFLLFTCRMVYEASSPEAEMLQVEELESGHRSAKLQPFLEN